ncbi:MAG: copper resistance protein CopC, partial [Chloroflexota bacterium]|nr:copper resistance protein CopC [Chloroflexota bacterium]
MPLLICAWQKRIVGGLVALIVTFIGVTLVPAPVSAHTALVAATPVPGSTIGQPPKTIRIRFDQIPDPKFNEITLLDTSGTVIAGGAATADAGDPSIVEVTLSAKIAPGLYTVAWQALANDGHSTKGNYSFTLASGLGPAPPLDPQPIGAPTSSSTASAPALSGSGNPSVLAVIVRWWRYLALGVLIGAFGLAVLVLRPAMALLDDGDAAWRRATRMLRSWAFGGLVAFVLAHFATLVVQAATVADLSLFQVRGDTLRRLAYNTTYGTVWRVIAVVALLFLVGMLATLLPFGHAHPPALGVIATPHPGARAATLPAAPPIAVWPWRLGLFVALLLAAALTFSSHAIEGQHQPVLAILADAAHLCAMGLWFGGLLILLVTLRRALRPLDAAAQTAYLVATIGRFSHLALGSIVCLIATGLYAMTIQTTRATILNTSYGQTLLIKHALIVPLIATAALNLRVVKPHLGDEERARRWLPRLLGIEATLGLAVLLVTATLTQLPPAHLLTGANAALADPRLANAVAVAPPTAGQHVDLSSGPQSAEMQDAAGMTIVLLTTTGKDGSALDANVADPQTGQPLVDVQRVTAFITFSSADLGQTSVLLARDQSGHYRATGIFFPIKGVWNVQLVIRRANIA